MNASAALSDAARLLVEAMMTLDKVAAQARAGSREHLAALTAAAHAQQALDALLRADQSGLPSLSR